MSEITTFFRGMAGDAAKDVSDENLAVFIGNNYPNLLNDEEFKQEFQAGREKRNQTIIQRRKDELELFTKEQTGKAGTTAFLGLGQGLAALEKSYAGIAESPLGWAVLGITGPVLKMTGLDKKIAKHAVNLEKQYADATGFRAGQSKVSEFTGQLASGAASMLPAATAAFFGGMPAASTAAGLQQFGSTYLDAVEAYKQKGLTQDEAEFKATGPAAVSGIITAGLTAAFGKFGGAERFLADFGMGKISIQSAKQLIKYIGITGGVEGMEEGTDQLLQGFLQQWSYNPEKTFLDKPDGTPGILSEAIMAAIIGGTLGTVVGSGGGLVAKFIGKPETKPETRPGGEAAVTEGTTTPPPTITETPETGVIVKELPDLTKTKPVLEKVEVEPNAISRNNLIRVAEDVYSRLNTIEEMGGQLTQKQKLHRVVARKLADNPNPEELDFQNAANLFELTIDENALTIPRPYEFLNPKGQETSELEVRRPAPTTTEQPVVEGVPEGGTVKPNVPLAETTGKVAPTEGPVEPAKPTGEVIPSGEVQEKGPEVVRPAATTAEVLGIKPAVAPETTAAETTIPLSPEFESKADEIATKVNKGGLRELNNSDRVWLNNLTEEESARYLQIIGEKARQSNAIESVPVEPRTAKTEEEVGGAAPMIPMIALNPKLLSKINDFFEWAKPRKVGTPPVILPSGDVRLPTLPAAWSVLKKAMTRPFAAGKIPILGLVLDPNARHQTFVGDAINAYWAVRGIGKAIAGTFGLELKGKIDSAFKVTNGELNVRRNPANPDAALYTSLAPSDVFEALQIDPSAYILTPEQRTAFEEANKVLSEISSLRKHYGLTKGEEDDLAPEQYFPRLVVEVPTKTSKGGGGGVRIGGKPGYEKSRVFTTESEGVGMGYKYEPSMEKRLVSMVERVYKEIADKMLIEDPDLGGIQKKIFRDQLRAYLAGTGKTGSALEQAVDNATARGTVADQPSFSKYVYDPDVAAELSKAFPKTSNALDVFNNANSVVKLFQLGYDWGVMFNQGVVMMFSHPKQWARAVKNSTKAFFNDQVLSRYANDNIELMRKAAQFGMTFGRLPEYLSRFQGSRGIEDVPYVGATLKPFMRQFETFMDVAKVELLKAYWDVTQRNHPEQLMQLVKSIESLTMSSRMESIGVRRGQAALERAAFMAPSYYRGGLNLVAMLGEGGVSSRIAVRALGAYMAGGTALFVALAKGIGMSWDEIWDRMDPRRGDFMMWKVKLPNGNTLNVGFGGFLKSLVRLGANIYDTVAKGRIEGFAKFTSEDNPIARWMRAHSASVPSLTWDALTGRDYLGEESYAGVLFARMLPFAIQDMLGREGTKKRGGLETALSGGLSFAGVQTYQESYPRERQAALDKIAREQYGKRFKDLPLGAKENVIAKFELSPTFMGRAVAGEKQIQLAVKRDQQNAKDISRMVDPKAMAVLEKNELRLPGQAVVEVRLDGRVIPLSEEEKAKFKELIAKEYSGMIMDFKDDLADREVKETVLKNILEKARKIAKMDMLEELEKKTK